MFKHLNLKNSFLSFRIIAIYVFFGNGRRFRAIKNFPQSCRSSNRAKMYSEDTPYMNP